MAILVRFIASQRRSNMCFLGFCSMAHANVLVFGGNSVWTKPLHATQKNTSWPHRGFFCLTSAPPHVSWFHLRYHNTAWGVKPQHNGQDDDVYLVWCAKKPCKLPFSKGSCAQWTANKQAKMYLKKPCFFLLAGLLHCINESITTASPQQLQG